MFRDSSPAVNKCRFSSPCRSTSPCRSDDSSFIERRIPAINFFTGFHDDYHRPGDDWEKVDIGGTQQVAALALELAARLAARPERPEFVAPR
jgi:di/tripeptidase